MIVRLGYVAIAMGLPKVTSSSTVTYAHYKRLKDDEKLDKLIKVTTSNFNDLDKILFYNLENQIHFYRLTSKLIPLATHKDVEFPYLDLFSNHFKDLGAYIIKRKMRIDAHPDQFNVINSEREDVFQNTLNTLKHQADMFDAMHYHDGLMILHIGSGKPTKDEAIERFISNFKRIPKKISKRIILENDDTTFTAKETLKLCQSLNIAMVLDVHHHNCKNDGEDLKDLLLDIFKTWENYKLPPKIHFSTPKDEKSIRSHHDYINVHDFKAFIEITKPLNIDFDVMIEAKMKDLALFKLVEELKDNTNYKWIDQSTFEV